MNEIQSTDYTDQELKAFLAQHQENLPASAKSLLSMEDVPVRSIVDRLHEAAIENPRVGRIWSDVLTRFPHREPLAFELRRKRTLRVVPKLLAA